MNGVQGIFTFFCAKRQRSAGFQTPRLWHQKVPHFLCRRAVPSPMALVAKENVQPTRTKKNEQETKIKIKLKKTKKQKDTTTSKKIQQERTRTNDLEQDGTKLRSLELLCYPLALASVAKKEGTLRFFHRREPVGERPTSLREKANSMTTQPSQLDG